MKKLTSIVYFTAVFISLNLSVAFGEAYNIKTFGAVGDGMTDDTAAIQRAMQSGRPVILFPKACYVVNGTVNIPASVREISFLWASVFRSQAKEPNGPGLFRVAEPSPQPLMLHETVTAGGVLLDHEADRPVILQDAIAWFHHGREYASQPNTLFPTELLPCC